MYACRPFFSVFEQYLLTVPTEYLDDFFRHWTPDQILKLRSLSSAVFYAVEAYIAYAWDPEKLLRRCFYDVRAFRRELDACRAIISGSEALGFFSRREFLGNDLDIYVPLHGLVRLGRYLDRIGYTYQRSGGKAEDFDLAAITFTSRRVSSEETTLAIRALDSYTFSAFNFAAPPSTRDPDATPARVQLIAVRGDPIELIINSFHSSEFSDR